MIYPDISGYIRRGAFFVIKDITWRSPRSLWWPPGWWENLAPHEGAGSLLGMPGRCHFRSWWCWQFEYWTWWRRCICPHHSKIRSSFPSDLAWELLPLWQLTQSENNLWFICVICGNISLPGVQPETSHVTLHNSFHYGSLLKTK